MPSVALQSEWKVLQYTDLLPISSDDPTLQRCLQSGRSVQLQAPVQPSAPPARRGLDRGAQYDPSQTRLRRRPLRLYHLRLRGLGERGVRGGIRHPDRELEQQG